MVSTNAVSQSQEQLFTNADIDDDGYLTQSEFEEGLPGEDFTVYDKNKDGVVLKEEYIQTVLEYNKKFVAEMWRIAMKIFKMDKAKSLQEVMAETQGAELD